MARLVRTNEDNPGGGVGDGGGSVPTEVGQQFLRGFDLAGTDEQGDPASGLFFYKSRSGGQDGGELFNGAQGDEIGSISPRFLKVLGAAGEYIDAGQFKCPYNFAEEGGFLVLRFDQGEVDFGGVDFDGQAGESGTRTEVDYFKSA